MRAKTSNKTRNDTGDEIHNDTRDGTAGNIDDRTSNHFSYDIGGSRGDYSGADICNATGLENSDDI